MKGIPVSVVCGDVAVDKECFLFLKYQPDEGDEGKKSLVPGQLNFGELFTSCRAFFFNVGYDRGSGIALCYYYDTPVTEDGFAIAEEVLGYSEYSSIPHELLKKARESGCFRGGCKGRTELMSACKIVVNVVKQRCVAWEEFVALYGGEMVEIDDED